MTKGFKVLIYLCLLFFLEETLVTLRDSVNFRRLSIAIDKHLKFTESRKVF